jgi:hypothetical protein
MDAETPSMRLLRPQALVQEEAIRYWATTTAYRWGVQGREHQHAVVCLLCLVLGFKLDLLVQAEALCNCATAIAYRRSLFCGLCYSMLLD